MTALLNTDNDTHTHTDTVVVGDQGTLRIRCDLCERFVDMVCVVFNKGIRCSPWSIGFCYMFLW